MPRCFVMQPFDAGKFDRRFEEVFKPAIEAAGVAAYRVDQDPSVDIVIDAIEQEIRSAAVCLADITVDNPNVWYELGFASACRKPIVMVCSEERMKSKFPFDIQHRAITVYRSDSPSDFGRLRTAITTRIRELLNREATFRSIAETDPVAPIGGLSQVELWVLATVAGSVVLPENRVYLHSVQYDAEQAGLTPIGFSLGLRKLMNRQFLELHQEPGSDSESVRSVEVTQTGWAWIESNENLFVIRYEDSNAPSEDYPPF